MYSYMEKEIATMNETGTRNLILACSLPYLTLLSSQLVFLRLAVATVDIFSVSTSTLDAPATASIHPIKPLKKGKKNIPTLV